MNDIADCDVIADARVNLQAALMALDNKSEREALDHTIRAAAQLVEFYAQTPTWGEHLAPSGHTLVQTAGYDW